MPSRRHHAKSRNGCVQCKKSHVKCDESFPQCSYCARRQISCSLSDAPANAGRSRDGTPRSSSSQAAASMPRQGPTQVLTRYPPGAILQGEEFAQVLARNRAAQASSSSASHTLAHSHSLGHTPGQSPGYSSSHVAISEDRRPSSSNGPPSDQIQPKSLSLRSREGFLLHHYITLTQQTFHETPVYSTQMWEIAMLSEAWKHDFLLDAILGLAALHCASYYLDREAEWLEMAMEYQDRALAKFGAIVRNIKPEQSHAAFGFSIVIMFLSFAMPCPDLTDPVEYCLTSRYNIQGIEAVVYQFVETLKTGGFAPWLALIEQRPCVFRMVPGEDIKAALRHLHDMSESSKYCATYFNAIGGLIRGAEKFSLDIVSWPVLSVDELFVSLLRDHDPMALLILAHYGLLLHHFDLEGKWWAKGIGRLHVDGLTTVLLKKRPAAEIYSAAEWVRAQVGLKTEPPGSD